MTANTLPVALVQEQNRGDAEANLATIEARVAEAAAAGARLVLLQELHNGPYFCQHENVCEFDLAETIPGPSTERLGPLAKKHGVVLVFCADGLIAGNVDTYEHPRSGRGAAW